MDFQELWEQFSPNDYSEPERMIETDWDGCMGGPEEIHYRQACRTERKRREKIERKNRIRIYLVNTGHAFHRAHILENDTKDFDGLIAHSQPNQSGTWVGVKLKRRVEIEVFMGADGIIKTQIQNRWGGFPWTQVTFNTVRWKWYHISLLSEQQIRAASNTSPDPYAHYYIDR